MNKSLYTLWLAAIIFLVLIQGASAGAYQYIGNGSNRGFTSLSGSSNWTQTSPWDGTPTSLGSGDTLDLASPGTGTATQFLAPGGGSYALGYLSASLTGQILRSSGSGTSTVNIGNNLSLTGTSSSLILYDSGATLSVSVTGNVSVASGSTLYLGQQTGSNTLTQFSVTGNTTVSGTLSNSRANSASTISLGDLTVNSGGSVIVVGQNGDGNGSASSTIRARSLSGSGSIYGSSVTFNNTHTGTLAVTGISSTNAAFSGLLSDSSVTTTGINVLALTYGGSGKQTLSGANTYSAGTTVTGGTLTGDSNTAFGTGSVAINAGKVIIATSRTMTNAFTVNGGSLIVNGTLSSSGSFAFGANGGTLGGGGTIQKSLTLTNANQILSPGNSPGIQTFSASQTWNAATYVWETDNWTGVTAGTNFDQIAITGNLALGGASANSLILDITSLTSGDVPGNVPNFSEINRQWTIVSTNGLITGFNAANWSIHTSNFSPSFSGIFSLSVTGGNNLVLSYTAVPEPSGTILIGIGMAGILCIFRRRSNKIGK